eukprot:CAMPEP_0184303544 /NCGR_PEP_ID=MMETSP1049-20130417/13277_1 /TAXON_ID=77928 /ORGANISM="Proteomonas sulcata, Strain CCMP704" /LENGTH=99 /DNA_ID=CAMNT_0026615125 /DNA_START=65 /DNA_END=364 /DNA_ORIENTATION=+
MSFSGVEGDQSDREPSHWLLARTNSTTASIPCLIPLNPGKPSDPGHFTWGWREERTEKEGGQGAGGLRLESFCFQAETPGSCPKPLIDPEPKTENSFGV